MADEPFSTRLSQAVNRRRLLRGAVGGAAIVAASVGPAWLIAPHRTAAQEIRTIVEDVEQRGAAFARGDRRTTDLGGGSGNDQELIAAANGAGQEFVSEPVQVDFPMTHIGAHWVARSSGGAMSVDVRWSSDGARWSDWTPTIIDAADGTAPNAGTFAALVNAKRATFAQYRLRFDTAGGSIRVRRFTLTCLNSVDGERVRILLPSTQGVSAAVAKPSVVTRAAWGCVESYRFRDGREIWPREYVTTRKVVVHHTATTNGYSNAAAEVRSIYYYHAVTQGWGDIGYHALIGNNNQIYEGRVGRDGEHVSLDVVAGHVFRCNEGTMGISNIGIFMGVSIPGSMLDAGAKIAAWICDQRGIDPKGTGPYRRGDGTTYNGWNLPGHKEIATASSPTACPGDVGVTQLPNFRDRVAAKIAGSYVPTATTSPTRGTVNTSVDYQISGFPANAAVAIEWRRMSGSMIDIDTVQLNPTGAASGQFRVPSTPGGNDQLIRFSAGALRAEAFYDVAPRIKIVPGIASRGSSVDVSLRGFGKKETVRIRWRRGSGWVELDRIVTSNTGSTNVDIEVPDWAPDGINPIRGDGTTFRAQTNAFTVSGGAFQSAEGTPSPSATPTTTPDALTPTPTEPTATFEPPAETPTTEPTVSPSATAEPSPTATATATPDPTETPAESTEESGT
ncbi:MAG: N-acetylmuramoyl-L-alanine amidase [Thermomicrobiales bacterium]